MAGFKDLFLAFARFLCGSPIQEEPPRPYQTTEVEQPQTKPIVVTRPQPPRIPPQHRRQEQSVIPQPRPERPSPQIVHTPAHPPSKDQKQANQHDEHYAALRAKASEHGDLMAQCFQESHEAYNRGERARAKELSNQGKQLERTMETLNAEASAWIFRQNNLECKAGEIDLHGLYVKEAVSYAEKAIQEARQRGDTELRLIVGKGLHSDGQVAKIKPAIEELMRKQGIPAEIDPRNGGVLVAQL